jgi:2'-hydroxyisoflavone reductase
MRILFLGGTVFLGRHIVESALARGHAVTLFTRGQRNPELFPQAEKLRGDRDGGLDPLRGRTWDAVVDTCGYLPRVVRQSAELLAGSAGQYAFISSISVYRDFSEPRVNEGAPLGVMPEVEEPEKITNETYGPLKVLCEQAVSEAFPNTALLIRPGLIVGPHDPTDRFTYWPARVAGGGEVLVPGRPEQDFQGIDVRDLGEWTVRAIEEGRAGPYNATAPDQPIPFQEVLDTCRSVSGSDATFTYVPGEFLSQQGLEPNSLHTWYLPDNEPEWRHAWNVDCARAIRDGLTFRPLARTIADTLAWERQRPMEAPRRVSLDPERERELLAAWKAQTA